MTAVYTVDLKNKTMAKKLKKYQAKNSEVKATADSTAYFKNKENVSRANASSFKTNSEYDVFNKRFFENEAAKAVSDQVRQSHKGQPGFDKDGNPVTAMDMLQRMYSTKKKK